MAAVQGFKEILVKFNDNVQAKLNVVLINADDENPAQVFGNIKGRFSLSSEFYLFNVAVSNPIQMSPGQSFPLMMSEVVVPSNAADLQITADLWDYDALSPNDQIANGTANFPVGKPGESNQAVIAGQYGSIQVNVLWG